MLFIRKAAHPLPVGFKWFQKDWKRIPADLRDLCGEGVCGREGTWCVPLAER